MVSVSPQMPHKMFLHALERTKLSIEALRPMMCEVLDFSHKMFYPQFCRFHPLKFLPKYFDHMPCRNLFQIFLKLIP